MTNVSKENSKLRSFFSAVLFSLLSVIIAILIAVIFVMWSKEISLIDSFNLLIKSLWYGSFGNMSSLTDTFMYTTIYIFTGLAHLVAFKTSLFNIGVEGQFTIGILASVIVGIIPGIPFFLHIILILLAGIIAGALWAFIPAYLKVKFNSNEVVNTIMMNFIAMHILNLCINLFLKEEGYEAAKSISKSAILPDISFGGTALFDYGLIIGIITIVIVYMLINKTKVGYNLRSVGYNKHASEYGGIDVKKYVIISMMLSGLLAGLGGSVFVSGIQHRVPKLNMFLNYGFDGIAVALLARNNPICIIITSILFGALNSASLELQFNGIPKDIVVLVQAIIILFIAGEYLFKYLFAKFKRGGAN